MKRALVAALLCVAAPLARGGEDPAAVALAVGQKFAAACAAGNVDAVLGLYRDDARVVYPGAGQSAANKAELRRLVAQTCVAGGAKFELLGYRAIWVDAAHSVVAALGDWRAVGTDPDGKPMSMPVRATEVLVKTSGGWKYAVDHASIGVAPPAKETAPESER